MLKYCWIFLLLIFCGCTLSNDQILSYNWKYGSGYYIGDAPSFKGMTIRNDTVFNKDSAIVIIVGSEKYFGHEALVIKSPLTGEEGKYFHK